MTDVVVRLRNRCIYLLSKILIRLSCYLKVLSIRRYLCHLMRRMRGYEGNRKGFLEAIGRCSVLLDDKQELARQKKKSRSRSTSCKSVSYSAVPSALLLPVAKNIGWGCPEWNAFWIQCIVGFLLLLYFLLFMLRCYI